VEGGGENLEPPRDEISPAEEQAMWEEIQRNLAMLRDAGALPPLNSAQVVTYNFPLRMAPGLPDYAGFRVSAFADHNPASGQVLDYNGGTRTYDSHRGTDYALSPFSWNKVDAGEAQVVAAADGTIINKANVDPTDHNCNVSSNDPWNYVALLHADGRLTIYGHMRYNSLTSKGVGATVVQGEYLGTAASSGNSSGPHLHFEVRYGSFSTAEWMDPYAGPNSQPGSLWANQRPYYDSAINKLSTHSSPPSTPNPCQPSITNLQDSFTSLSNIYLYAYYRDYQGTLSTQLKIYRPDASVYKSWQYTPGSPAFSSEWKNGWVENLPANEPAGTWRFEATYNGHVYETPFTLKGSLVARDDFIMTPLNTPVTIDILSNDGLPNSNPITITVGVPMSGTVSLVSTHLVYTPTLDFLGPDVFTYTVRTNTEQANATVTVLVVTEVFRVFLPLIQR
jgi:murein DD-endopeptidase MepM/ murein hydrolase activator NlpD